MLAQQNCPRAATTLLTLLTGLALWAWTAATVGQDAQESSPAEESRRALARGDAKRALELTTAALRKNPQNREFQLIRASAFDSLRRHKEAVEDYDVLLRATPDSASIHHLRGRSRFKLGDVDGSIDDFGRATELEPRLEMRLWERGISLYYAAKYAEGARQFEAYQRYDASDVENVVWRYLCQAQAEGVEKAREAILPLVREDPRVPMMTIYALYRGQATPDAVLAAAQQEVPSGTNCGTGSSMPTSTSACTSRRSRIPSKRDSTCYSPTSTRFPTTCGTWRTYTLSSVLGPPRSREGNESSSGLEFRPAEDFVRHDQLLDTLRIAEHFDY